MFLQSDSVIEGGLWFSTARDASVVKPMYIARRLEAILLLVDRTIGEWWHRISRPEHGSDTDEVLVQATCHERLCP